MESTARSSKPQPIPWCQLCRFFQPDDRPSRPGPRHGDCRRRPPAVAIIPGRGMEPSFTLTRWPRVPATAWCGEWEERR